MKRLLRFTPGIVLSLALVGRAAQSATPPSAPDRPPPADEKKPEGEAPSDAFAAFVAGLPIRSVHPAGHLFVGTSGTDGRLHRIGDVVEPRSG